MSQESLSLPATKIEENKPKAAKIKVKKSLVHSKKTLDDSFDLSPEPERWEVNPSNFQMEHYLMEK